MGRDPDLQGISVWDDDFYSHALVGRDQFGYMPFDPFMHFYSHALVGRDNGDACVLLEYEISTHTPSWGVTYSTLSCGTQYLFLLTRPRGA